MKSVSGKDLARTLERHGWSLLRVQGSHHIYGKQGSEYGFLCRFTEIKLSRLACSSI